MIRPPILSSGYFSNCGKKLEGLKKRRSLGRLKKEFKNLCRNLSLQNKQHRSIWIYWSYMKMHPSAPSTPKNKQTNKLKQNKGENKINRTTRQTDKKDQKMLDRSVLVVYRSMMITFNNKREKWSLKYKQNKFTPYI